eukprot:6200832-Prymnesium_polylepis.1
MEPCSQTSTACRALTRGRGFSVPSGNRVKGHMRRKGPAWAGLGRQSEREEQEGQAVGVVLGCPGRVPP